MEETQKAIDCGQVLLPPSPNWFSSGAMDTREQDRLMVTASFRAITIYRIQVGAKPPLVLKSITHGQGKVLQVRVFPDASHKDLGSIILVSGEYGTVSLYNADTGAPTLQHDRHKENKENKGGGGTIGGICFVTAREDVVVAADDDDDAADAFPDQKVVKETIYAVSVASEGVMEVWNIATNFTTRHIIKTSAQHHHHHKSGLPNLTLVEPVPGAAGGDDGNVIVVADKVILLVNVKSGCILSQLRGHDQSIYCLRWFTGHGSPLGAPLPVNDRATAMRVPAGPSSSNGSDSSNWRSRAPPTATTTTANETDMEDGGSSPTAAAAADPAAVSSSTGRYLATSDTARNILLWDLNSKQYIAKATIPAVGAPKKGERSGGGRFRTQAQHVSLAWHNSDLIVNYASGDVASITFWGNEQRTSSFDNMKNGKSKTEKRENSEDATEGTAAATESGINGEKNGGGTGKEKTEKKSCGAFNIKQLHREHNRVVYNIVVVDGMAISSSQDRSLVGFCLKTKKVCFNIPTIGGIVNTMTFSPHDSTWLTLGLQESCIKMVSLHSTPSYRQKSFFSTIRGKVLALSFHPEKELSLLYGTNEGQVGLVDCESGKVSPFSYFHQKSVYKVEWAPSVLEEHKPGSKPRLYAYSIGDREVVMRNPETPMADPLKLIKQNENLPNDVSEFAFSPDYKFLAIGCQDGHVTVLRCSDFAQLVKMVFVRKSIQHLLWQQRSSSTSSPTSSSNGTSNTEDKTNKLVLAIASNDSRIFLIDLNTELHSQLEKLAAFKASLEKESELEGDESESKKEFEPTVLMSCDRELSGHATRVVWLSYSHHNPDILASASYDHTCQIWNTATGEQLGNYRGHLTRVFRVEFSPDEAGLMYSVGEENSVHHWRISDLKHKSPPSKVNKIQEPKPKTIGNEGGESKKDAAGGVVAACVLSSVTEGKGAAVAAGKVTAAVGATVGGGKTLQVSGHPERRTASHKSLFPVVHFATSHKKRGFHLLAMLCMHQQHQLEDEYRKAQDQKSLEELLDGDDDGETTGPVTTTAASHYPAVLRRLGGVLLEDDPQNPPPLEDMETLLEFYGPPTQLARYVKKQIADHDSNGREVSSCLLHSWQGSLEERVKAAIAAKTVTADMVALAPQISLELWEVASEAYAQQLAADGDPLLASSYLINAKKNTEAVELLLKHKLYREALVLAKTRMAYSTELHHRVTTVFASTVMYEGNYDLAALLFSSCGDYSGAANSLCRRGDPASLLVGGLLYHAQGHTLAASTLLDAIKCAGAKGMTHLIPVAIEAAPQYRWFGLIVIVLDTLLKVKATAPKNGYMLPAKCAGQPAVSVMERILQRWASEGYSTEELPHMYDQHRHHLHTSQQPTTSQQFWFLVSVELTALLLNLSIAPAAGADTPATSAPVVEGDDAITGATEQASGAGGSAVRPAAAEHLQSVLQQVLVWGNAQHAHDVTHMMLPKGPGEAPGILQSLLATTEQQKEGQEPSSVQLLCSLYYTTECYRTFALLQGSPGGEEESTGAKEDSAADPKVDEISKSLSESSISTTTAETAAVTESSSAAATTSEAGTPVTTVSEAATSVNAAATTPAKSTAEFIATLRSLIACLSTSRPVIPNANLYKLSDFNDPKQKVNDILEVLSTRGDVDQTVILELRNSLAALQ